MNEPREVADAARSIMGRVMTERLTPTEARRVRLLFGLDTGRELSERQVSVLEKVERVSVREARDSATSKLASDWRLWALSLLMDAQPARWFECDHCKNDCGYPETVDGVFIQEMQAA